MTIRIWQAFSCNNSGAYRLVARFDDAATATTVAAELRKLLADFGAEDREDRQSGSQALARLYGFDWEDDGYGGPEDGPRVFVDESTLIVQQGYGLGLGPGVPAFLQEHGATAIDKETWDKVHVSVLFRISADPRLEDELLGMFTQPTEPEHVVQKLEAPWAEVAAHGNVAFFRDAGTVGLFFPIDARDLVRLRAWLADRNIENPIVQLEAYPDQALFIALAAARCRACDGALEYLDPRLHDIETPQLVCRPCGGLYELSTFLPKP